MADGSIQKLELILQADLLELGTGGGIHLRLFTAVAGVDVVHITHQVKGLFLPYILVESTAEVVGDVIFPV